VSDFAKLDERDPFIQLVFKSVAIATSTVFVVALAIVWIRPELLAPLIVPISAALFVGALGFQVELALRQYVLAVLWLFAAILLFPAAGWLLLLVLHVPYEATQAKFIPLIPQAVAAPAVFMAAKRRFDAGERSRNAR
jgi:hypothetical protein